MQSLYQDHESPTPVVASYRELQRQKLVRAGGREAGEERRGLLGAWLSLTAPAAVSVAAPLEARERLRKAELTTYVLAGVLVAGIVLIPAGLQGQPALGLAAGLIIAAILAGVLNRFGYTSLAAVLLVAGVGLGLVGALVALPTLELAWMPALYFFAVPVLLAAMLLPRGTPFLVAALGVAAVALLVALQPRDVELEQAIGHLGIGYFVAGPIALMCAVALAAWLWARSVDLALSHADRAEELAVLRYALVEERRQIDVGIQCLLEAHVRAASGDFLARANLGQENALWQVAFSLNNLLGRLGRYAHVDHRLQRTEYEIDRLALAMERARAGQGMIWPPFSGTRVDRLLSLLRSGSPQTPAALMAPPGAPTPGVPFAQPPRSGAAGRPPVSPSRPIGSFGSVGSMGPMATGPLGTGPLGERAAYAEPNAPDTPLSGRHERAPRTPRYTVPLQSPSAPAERPWPLEPLPPLPPMPARAASSGTPWSTWPAAHAAAIGGTSGAPGGASSAELRPSGGDIPAGKPGEFAHPTGDRRQEAPAAEQAPADGSPTEEGAMAQPSAASPTVVHFVDADRGDEEEWPDWPSFLRSIAEQES